MEPMKKYLSLLTFLLFVLTAVPFSASTFAKGKKATAHKHSDKSSCCCDIKSTKRDKQNDRSKMNPKTVDDNKASQAK